MATRRRALFTAILSTIDAEAVGAVAAARPAPGVTAATRTAVAAAQAIVQLGDNDSAAAFTAFEAAIAAIAADAGYIAMAAFPPGAYPAAIPAGPLQNGLIAVNGAWAAHELAMESITTVRTCEFRTYVARRRRSCRWSTRMLNPILIFEPRDLTCCRL
jgi:hypothetical protein